MEENLLTITTNPVSTPELSEEEDWDTETSELTGTLNKWTNYIHGWQKRFMAIKVRNKKKAVKIDDSRQHSGVVNIQ